MANDACKSAVMVPARGWQRGPSSAGTRGGIRSRNGLLANLFCSRLGSYSSWGMVKITWVNLLSQALSRALIIPPHWQPASVLSLRSTSPKTRRNDVVSDFAMEPHHLKLLQAACEAWNRAQLTR